MELTKDELKCLNTSATLWNQFIRLPQQHPDDTNEMRAKIHDIQRVILSRVAERQIQYKPKK